MKVKLLLVSAILMGMTLTSCDETTEMIGGSLIDNVDKLVVDADTFNVSSKSILAKDIIARSAQGYLGSMRDKESDLTVTANFMTQFHVLSNYEIPEEDKITSRDANNQIIADSCEIKLYYSKFYGDSLSQMKLTTYELSKPIEEGNIYYADFDPKTKGYVRSDGIKVKQTYTLSDQTTPDSIRLSKNFSPAITINLNRSYTDKEGKSYNNYGTYLMRKYFENTKSFRNPYLFLHDICPGFYFEITNGIGAIAKINAAQINIFFIYKNGETSKSVNTNLISTEEVLQMTNFDVSTTRLQQLASESDHTYLKTPVGLFTELTLPIDNIKAKHENQDVNSAKIELKCMNRLENSNYKLDVPQNVIMLPADSLTAFFSNKHIADNKTSFLATYNSKTNSYTFNNIAGIVNLFIQQKASQAMSEKWGKVVVVPVELETAKIKDDKVVITKISHYMGLTGVKLLGNDNINSIKISVIYNKFNNGR